MSEAYLDALARKAEAFESLLVISRGQDLILEQDDPDALPQLVGRKRALMEQIEGIDRDLAASRGAWEALGASAPQARAELLIRRIRATLETIVACENATGRRAEALRQQTLADMSRLKQGRRAAELYRRPVQGQGGRAVDREE